ncbi:Hypothetical protein NTJ_12994 [Nesidiocoris tenuis]|nr:Hypothetical protein NTJ_12994 [Nesidiocoris tenuis]
MLLSSDVSSLLSNSSSLEMQDSVKQFSAYHPAAAAVAALKSRPDHHQVHQSSPLVPEAIKQFACPTNLKRQEIPLSPRKPTELASPYHHQYYGGYEQLSLHQAR